MSNPFSSGIRIRSSGSGDLRNAKKCADCPWKRQELQHRWRGEKVSATPIAAASRVPRRCNGCDLAWLRAWRFLFLHAGRTTRSTDQADKLRRLRDKSRQSIERVQAQEALNA